MGGIEFDVNKFANDYKTPATVIATGTLVYFYLKLLLYFIVAYIVLSIISSCVYCYATGMMQVGKTNQTTKEEKTQKRTTKKSKKTGLNIITNESTNPVPTVETLPIQK